MTSSDTVRRILIVSPKQEAQPVLAQLRSSGHQVSLVEDLDEAGAVLAMSPFDQALLQGKTLETLLEQRMVWEGSEGEHWRRSTAALTHDLRGLLAGLAGVMREVRDPPDGRANDEVRVLADAVDSLSVFADELSQELSGSVALEMTRPVDLEDVAEAAAIAVYPSAADRQQRISIDIDPDVATIATVPVRLKRALKSLLEFVSTRAPVRGNVAIRASRAGDDCVISVSCDSPSAGRFDLAAQTRSLSGSDGRPGPLALAQELLERIDGRLWIESEKGGGVSVFMAVPQIWSRSPSLAIAGSE